MDHSDGKSEKCWPNKEQPNRYRWISELHDACHPRFLSRLTTQDPQLGPQEATLDGKRGYLDDIGGEPMVDSGFEDEEPDQTEEPTLEKRDTEFGGDAA